MKKLARSFRELEVYQSTFNLQQRLFELSKAWPAEERFALTSQVRRRSRSIGANIAEAWSKRRYPAHFLSKLTDADCELQETLHWIDTGVACGYISEAIHQELISHSNSLGRQLGTMIQNSDLFCS